MSDPDLDDLNLEEDDDLVVLTGEDGEDHPFRLIALLDVDDQQFAMLIPAEQEADDSETADVYLLHYTEDADGMVNFSSIEDPELFAKVQAAAEQAFAEADETTET